MSGAAGEFSGDCPSEEIGAYLDAELSPERAAALEVHFAGCAVCRDELNSQKAFLLELSRSLEAGASLELPQNFAKAVVTKAESSVSGLRKRSERIAAVSIIGVLVLLALIGFAGDPSQAYSDATRPLGNAGAFLDIAAGLLYSVVFAVGFVAKKVFSGTVGSGLLLVAVAGIAAGSFFVFKRYRRAAGNVG
jgi:anti-sigma factor RsiW